MNKKLQKIFQSYFIGRIKPISQEQNIKTILNQMNSFNQRRQTTMMAHLPLKYLVSIKQITNASRDGLLSLFQGQVLDAKQIYRTANKIIKSSQLNDEAFLIIKDDFNASKSYFDYHQRNYESARVNLQISLEACMALINQYGYDFFQPRPIHLACNMVKIEACSGNREKAMKIACYLISNMEGNYDSSFNKDINLLEPIQHLSFVLDENFPSALFTQVFDEIAKLLASCDANEANKLIDLASNLVREYNLSSNKQFEREYTWLKNRLALGKGKTTEFLEESNKFLAEGRGSCKFLWHATVLDILKICQNIDSEISRKLQKQIADDFASYNYLPGVLKA